MKLEPTGELQIAGQIVHDCEPAMKGSAVVRSVDNSGTEHTMWLDNSPLHSDAVGTAKMNSKLIVVARSQRTHAVPVGRNFDRQEFIPSLSEDRNPHRMSGDEAEFDEIMVVAV